MAEIRPFRGVRYNPGLIKDLSQVICPPYDIISSQYQEELYRRNRYNFVRIEYNQETAQDNPGDNRYTRSAANIGLWLKEGILEIEAAPAIYFHRHYFNCQGKPYVRNNLIAGVRLEPWEKKIILPHENIIPRAKSDRLSMLRACQANTSPVLAMYEDPRRAISAILDEQKQSPPGIDVVDEFGDRHQVWSITRPQAVTGIQKVISNQPLYIADGHHRYDSALTYCRERAAQSSAYTGEEGYNFVMTSLIDFADPGLVILPSHRLLKGISSQVLSGLKSRLAAYFEIEEFSINLPDIWQRVDSLLSGIRPETQKVRLAIFGLESDKLLVLTLKDQNDVNSMMPAAHGGLYRKLDVSLVDHVILDKLLAFDKDAGVGALDYVHDRLEVVNRVRSGEYQLAFILNPVQPELIRAVADAGDRMPRKSTYFYPKAPAGLVFYKW